MGVTDSDDHPILVGDGASAQALVRGQHRKLGRDPPVLVLLLLTEELDTLVDLDVLLATDVRGLELILTHLFLRVLQMVMNWSYSTTL